MKAFLEHSAPKACPRLLHGRRFSGYVAWSRSEMIFPPPTSRDAGLGHQVTGEIVDACGYLEGHSVTDGLNPDPERDTPGFLSDMSRLMSNDVKQDDARCRGFG